MKLTTFLIFIVMVGVVFTSITLFADDLDTAISDNPISIENYSDQYNYIDSLNSSVGAIQDKFDTITDEDKGFFSKLGAGIVAIPYAVVLFPKAILVGLGNVKNLITSFSTFLGLPASITYAAIFLITIFILGLLIKFFQKNEG